MSDSPFDSVPMVPTPVRRESAVKRFRRLLLGSPVSSEHMEHTLLPKFLALPVFASDAISSVAYATQQIILALGAAGLYLTQYRDMYTRNTLLIAGLIVLLLVIVVFSYWQTIFAYPKGGGSYIVTKDNLGTMPGLVAAAALLIDYVLTVSVSIASGVQNLANIPIAHHMHLDSYLVWICLLFIAVLTLANLRGLKESGAVFAVFTYGFVLMCFVMIAVAIVGPLIGWAPHLHEIQEVYAHWPAEAAANSAKAFGAVVMLRAFANGCSAMTGTEAVSDGIPAFQEPKAKNAALTLAAMGVILGSIFIGVTWLAMHFHVVYWEHDGKTAPAVIDQISGAVFGKTGPMSTGYLLTQSFTAAVLVLAANTAYADFPRLSSFLARDRFAPKQFANLGDKLVFNNGIVLLGIFASVLIIVKQGQIDALIPLYATGVFTAFTLSQSSMVVRWNRIKGPGWRQKAFINGFGAITTLIVLGFIVMEKFKEGAWIVILLICVFVLVFRVIHHHYSDVAAQLRLPKAPEKGKPFHNTVLVLVPGLHRGMLSALTYARSLSPDCRAVYIETDPEKTASLKARWEEWSQGIPLVILNSPYRSLASPIMQYLDAVQTERRHHLVTVIVPEFVPTKWWHTLLHGNSGLLLKIALLGRKDVIVTNVRYYLQEMDEPPPKDALAEEIAPAVPKDDLPGGTAHVH
ncbi:MAG TPA: APC family permease [Chthonomonadaceae bacterium]|nr:APC family permease [Chthonomonadaceae bacterium]